ncbi:hypothetical protein [Bradyrhizobium sp. 197]|uniref:hypothetical protein n=1 Tax=Bradyrhizobium sp. 197 TaxID=2782663 RepID=UPI001FFB25F5|nr:hypothetical protein [Bradyrhizobium sp. 197]
MARVIIANPPQVKAIAQAHVTTAKIDAGTLASLRVAGYLPQIWTPDAETERKRRLVARRYQVVRHRMRLKNEVLPIPHAHLIPKCPHADLFNTRPQVRAALTALRAAAGRSVAAGRMARSATEQKNGLTAISAIAASAMKKSLVHLIRGPQVFPVLGR